MTMREERAGKRQKGDTGTGEGETLELQSPTVQEMEEFLNVKMSPRSKAPVPSLEEVQRGANKHVVESRTDQDSMDDGYRCASSLLSHLSPKQRCSDTNCAIRLLILVFQENRRD